MIPKSIYGYATKIISKIKIEEWPKEVDRTIVESIYHLDMWTETMPTGEKYLWATLVNTADTTDYRLLKREKVNA